jgi:hypothetical protein
VEHGEINKMVPHDEAKTVPSFHHSPKSKQYRCSSRLLDFAMQTVLFPFLLVTILATLVSAGGHCNRPSHLERYVATARPIRVVVGED